jgi:hypothetical protein
VTLKDQAEFLARALESGLKTVPEVIAWADENIMRLESPPHWLLELSMMGKAKGQDVVQALHGVAGIANETSILRAFFSLILEKIRSTEMSVEESCRILYRGKFQFPEAQARAIQDFDDRYDWSHDADMTSHVPADIDREFVTFLEQELQSSLKLNR